MYLAELYERFDEWDHAFAFMCEHDPFIWEDIEELMHANLLPLLTRIEQIKDLPYLECKRSPFPKRVRKKFFYVFQKYDDLGRQNRHLRTMLESDLQAACAVLEAPASAFREGVFPRLGSYLEALDILRRCASHAASIERNFHEMVSGYSSLLSACTTSASDPDNVFIKSLTRVRQWLCEWAPGVRSNLKQH